MELVSGYIDSFFLIIPAILFVATYNVKNRTRSIIYQRIALISVFLILLFHAVFNFLSVNNIYNIVYTATFLVSEPLVYFGSATLYYFTVSSIEERAKIKLPIKLIPIFLGVVVIGLWVYSYFSGIYYTANVGEEIIYGKFYIIARIISLIPLVINIVITCISSKKIGIWNTLALLFYAVFPLGCLPPTIIFGLPFTYIAMVISLLVIHIMITVNRQFEYAEQKRELAEKQLELNESMTRIMISQIQPHFLYNSLATIGYICQKDPMTASKAIDAFAEYLRTNLKAISSSKTVPFSEELEHVKTYLWLEKMRFEERLNVIYNIEATDFEVPCLSIQPLVENAVKHGLLEKQNGGTLTIRTVEYGEEYLIIITDDGVGFDVNTYNNDGRLHVGINNVKSRLESMCDATLSIVSKKGKGTTATIRLKKEKQ